MVNRDRTIEKFGEEHNPDKISLGSHKKIVINCDYCGKEIDVTMKNRVNSIKNTPEVPKDACKMCVQYKRIEIKKVNGTYEQDLKKAKEKYKQTCLEKYGVECASKVPEFANKMKETWRKKTSEEIRQIKDKQKQTCLDKYGVEYTSRVEEVKEKGKRTMLERYGVENMSQVSEFQEKKKQTFIERYGADNPSKNPEVLEKIRKSMEEKYGSHYFQTEEFRIKQKEYLVNQPEEEKERIRQKKIETNRRKYGTDYPTQNEEVKEKTRNTLIQHGEIKLYDGKRIIEWAKELGVTRSFAGYLLRTFDLETVKNFEKKISYIEQIVMNLLDKRGIEYLHNGAIENRKYDIFIDKSNLILELDGIYFHSEFNNKPKEYHKEKRDFYLSKGLSSIFFREDEIENKIEIVESVILDRLNKQSKNYSAQECSIEEIPFDQAREWFIQNHLSGSGAGKTFALKSGDKIVAAIQVKKKRDKIFEISRFATVNYCNVSGAFSKLLSHIENFYEINSLIHIVDLRFETENNVKENGFDLISEYLSFKWVGSHQTYHRMKYPANSGYDHGCAKIWDCGQAKYIKNYLTN